MSAPYIWIIVPAIGGGILFIFRRAVNVNIFASAGLASILAWVAWQVPVGEALTLGNYSIKIDETWEVLGRDITLTGADQPFISFLYLMVALWFLGAYFAQPGELFPSLGLMIVSLLVAALAVEPFLYAALLIEVAVLLSVPLLVPPGTRPGRGIFRYLTFQTLGMPFLLFTGWMLAGVEASPSDLDLVVRAGVLIGLGFTFLLAVFPFHSWVPMLAKESHPFVAGYVLFLLTSIVALFGLSFLNRYVWLRDVEIVYSTLRTLGALMVLAGGIWAAFQTHLGKMMGYAIVMETGYSLLAAGLSRIIGIEIFFFLILPRGLGLLVWSAAAGHLRKFQKMGLDFKGLQGAGLQHPFLAASVILGQLSLVGLPLLIGYPVRAVIWRVLASLSPLSAAGAVLGSAGLLLGSLRTLSIFVQEQNDGDSPESIIFAESDKPPILIFFSISIGLLVLGGLLPQMLLPAFVRMTAMLPLLAP